MDVVNIGACNVPGNNRNRERNNIKPFEKGNKNPAKAIKLISMPKGDCAAGCRLVELVRSDLYISAFSSSP